MPGTSLSRLPLELLCEIASFLVKQGDMNNMARICRDIYEVVNPLLYRRNRKEFNNSAIDWGARRNSTGTIQRAVEAGAVVTDELPLILYFAVLAGHAPVVKFLLENCKMDPSWYPKDRRRRILCPAFAAAEISRLDILQLLMDHTPDPLFHCHSHTLPSYAVHGGYYQTVEFLLNNGLDPSSCRFNGETLLHVAVRADKLAVAELLLDHGADHALKDSKGQTAFDVCLEGTCDGLLAGSKCIPIAQLLYARGAKLSPECDEAVPRLYKIARSHHDWFAYVLLEAGDDPNAIVDSGKRCLHSAARHGTVDMINALLAYGASIDSQCDRGRTALYEAVHAFRPHIVECLVDAGANMELADVQGSQPLHIAAAVSLEMVIFLLNKGASMTKRNVSGLTPLAVALSTNCFKIADELRKRGAH